VTELDPVLQKLAQLPQVAPPNAVSQKLQAAAHARLVPARVHPAWSIAVAASVLVYLGWAILYTSQLF